MDWLSSVYFVGVALFLLLVPTFILLAALSYVKKKEASRRVSPLTEELFRTPGFSLQQQIDNAQWTLMESLLMIPALTAIVPMFVFLQAKAESKPLSLVSWVPIIILIVPGVIYYGRKFFKQVKKVERLRLAYACEVALGQKLEQIVRPDDRPYRVFHDIFFDDFNVDHIVIGPNGVFVIETKGRSKPITNGDKQFKVRVEKDALHFPKHTEHKPITQTRNNVKAVRNWLSSATGFDVPVGGVLVIPGWFIEQKQRLTAPYIMNSAQLSSQFSYLRAGSLDMGQIKAIAHQVSQRVQDVDRKRVDRAVVRTVNYY